MADEAISVLLIEDDPDDMFYVRELLSESKGNKFAVIHADTLAGGLEKIANEEIDVILTDLSLPDAHGMETFQEIRKCASGKPVVVLSGNDDVDMAKESVRLGAQDYLVKGDISEGLLTRALLYARERKNMELTLIQSERLAGLGTLAGGVAHEFNNIHSIVLGYLELTLSFADIDDKVRMYLEHVKEAVQRAATVTSNLLSFASKPKSEKTEGNVNVIIKNTVAIVKNEYESEGITFVTDFRDVESFEMNQALIGQVVFNFLVNARHALLERQNKEIHLRSWQSGDKVYFAVADNGCGIALENLKNIFTPFFTTKGEFSVGESALSQVKGTGLGLSVCHNIVSSHDGRISVNSEINKGTTFTVELPVVRPERETTEDEPAMDYFSMAKGGRVMIVDDEKDILNILGDGLRVCGLEVSSCTDGKEALSIVAHDGVDVILTDLQMPFMEGFIFLQELGKVVGDNPPQIFVLTGKPVPPERRKVMLDDLCVKEILTKPFKLQEMQKLVCKAIVERRRGS